MLSLHELLALLNARMADLVAASSEAYTQAGIVKVISWFFLTLGLTLGIPIALLIVFDFIFWVYRLAVPDRTKHTSTAVSSSRARRRTDAAAMSKAASSSHRQHPLTAS